MLLNTSSQSRRNETGQRNPIKWPVRAVGFLTILKRNRQNDRHAAAQRERVVG